MSMIGTTNCDNSDVVFFLANLTTGGGDGSYSTWLPFNYVHTNIGGGTLSSAGHYIVPRPGWYLVNFTNYSNSPGNGRSAVCRLINDNDSTRDEMRMGNNNYTTSITGIYKCNKGDGLVGGAYANTFPISVYRAGGHNSLTVFRLK